MNTPHYQASKWLKLQLLLDPSELESLLTDQLLLFPLSGVQTSPNSQIPLSSFLSKYTEYTEALRAGRETSFEGTFAITVEPECLGTKEVGEGKYLVRILRPVIQVQQFRFSISEEGGYHPGSLGTNSIPWGLVFSFPQLFMNPETSLVEKPLLEHENGKLFKTMQRWARQHTSPASFMKEGKKINTTARYGKKMVEWVCELSKHPLC